MFTPTFPFEFANPTLSICPVKSFGIVNVKRRLVEFMTIRTMRSIGPLRELTLARFASFHILGMSNCLKVGRIAAGSIPALMVYLKRRIATHKVVVGVPMNKVISVRHPGNNAIPTSVSSALPHPAIVNDLNFPRNVEGEVIHTWSLPEKQQNVNKVQG